MAWVKKPDPLKADMKTKLAAKIGQSASKSRKGRDKLTRVTSPITEGVRTNGKQWNRYNP